MRRCPCRGSLSEAEAQALPAAARMGLAAPRGGRRRQPGQQRPGPGAGGPVGRPEGGGPRARTEESNRHTEPERASLGLESGADGRAEPEAAGLGAETERPNPTTEPGKSILRTHLGGSSHWSELETAGDWTETGTDGFWADPHRTDLQSQPQRTNLWAQPGVDGPWTELEKYGSQTQSERAKPRADNLCTQNRSSVRTQPEGVPLSTERSADSSWKQPFSEGSRTQKGTEDSWTELHTDGSQIQQDTETAWKQLDPGGFPTQDTDGLWSQPGTDGPQTEPRTDCLLGEPNQDDSLEEPEHRELVTHLYSHLEGSTLTPVPRLIITPETPEPEARPGGPPSQLEAGSGGFSSASSFDESEDDVVAGGGGASDPEDRSGVSGTHCTLEPDPHRPHSPPPNSPTPAFPLRSSLELHQQFYLQAPLPSTNLFPLTAGFLALQAPSSSFSPFPRLQSWGLKWMAAGQLHGTQEPLKVA